MLLLFHSWFLNHVQQQMYLIRSHWYIGMAVTTSTPTTAQASDSIMSAPSRSQSAPPQLADTPSHASKRRRRQEAASPSPDPVEQGILDQLASLSSIMRPQPSRDESDNIGSMVVCQHRTLNPEQKGVFLNRVLLRNCPAVLQAIFVPSSHRKQWWESVPTTFN